MSVKTKPLLPDAFSGLQICQKIAFDLRPLVKDTEEGTRGRQSREKERGDGEREGLHLGVYCSAHAT